MHSQSGWQVEITGVFIIKINMKIIPKVAHYKNIPQKEVPLHSIDLNLGITARILMLYQLSDQAMFVFITLLFKVFIGHMVKYTACELTISAYHIELSSPLVLGHRGCNF